MDKIILLGIALVFSAACAMPQGGMVKKRRGGLFDGIGQESAQQQAQPSVDETFEVITEPPGARIMVNNANYGNSPVRVTVRRMWRGDPNYPMILDTVKVEAFPVESGQCVQTGIFGQNAAKTPPQVRFNMASCAPTSGK
ncbi:MAG: hypothetical protein A2X28_05170 [Elusimicrobia bacterium GWA2_56_46]|nr:MAG: hypothetical protein A2X28_05170 [Elusimicrobia bacterium GWA2_56_46]OGR55254.1 MAG: hypothetical protein A2X39_04335 [Elusimicrobia bacterium GWC2_56_31]HBW22762.1 hypothetical protein [Elusimicrobiota bacterium]